jgi:hypothetical protein
MTFPAAEMAIASGKTVLPKFCPKTLSKNNAAMSSPLSFTSFKGTTEKYATFTSRYSRQAVKREAGATVRSVRTGFFTSLRTLLTFCSPA